MRRKVRLYKRWCNVYLEARTERAIVATCFNVAGLQAEVRGGARLLEGAAGALGVETLAALDACRWEPNYRFPRDAKPSDWPAYQASGESSIKRFEQRWHGIRVAGANEHNVTWELSASLAGDFGLSITAAVAPTMDATRLEDAIRYLGNEVTGLLASKST